MKCQHCNGTGEIHLSDMGIGAKLRYFREAKNMTLRDAERISGVSNPAISQIETGRVQKPSFEVVVKLCKAYEVNPEELLP